MAISSQVYSLPKTPWEGYSPPTTNRPLQRKCACGGTPGPSGECEACKRNRLAPQPKLTINQPGDHYEKEADAMAEAVMTEKRVNRPVLNSLGAGSAVQRDEPPKLVTEYKEKTQEEKYKEAAKKAGEAFLKTAPGKEIEKKAEELGDAFISTLPGKVITGTAIAGAVTALAVTHKELPIGIPEIPLDRIKPGLKMKITYEGPVDKPTKVMATFSFSFGGGGKSAEKKPKQTQSEKYRAETARLAAEQAQFREGLKSDEQKAAEKRMFDAYLQSKMLRPDQLTPRASPLSFGVAGKELGFHPGVPSPGPRSSLGMGVPDLKLSGETSEEPKKKEEETLQRKASGNHDVAGAPPIVDEVLQSPGEPLDLKTRRAFEDRFGFDFRQVRIHHDARAAESARAISAHAYTVGSDIAFDTSRYDPKAEQGQRLLAHELVHVMQQAGGQPMVQRETYYGGGYKQRAYANLDAEIAAGQKKPSEWHPATPDMAATAAGSGGGESVSTLDELLTKLEGKGKGSIKRLNLIGHSNSVVFSFGGKITQDNVEFSPDAALYADALKDNSKRIAALKDRFAEGAKIVLYSCDAGTGQGLLDAVGEAFGVCVEGFTSEIWWCLTKKDGKAARGHIWAQNPNDPLPPEHPPDCETLSSNIATLTTGGKSKQCETKKAAP